jgi:hypothetical protein
MAKFEMRFFDVEEEKTFIRAWDNSGKICICINIDEFKHTCIFLDKSTAIKFAKTLRTEINKITEKEVYNG